MNNDNNDQDLDSPIADSSDDQTLYEDTKGEVVDIDKAGQAVDLDRPEDAQLDGGDKVLKANEEK